MAKRNAIYNALNTKHYLQPAFLICAAVLAIAGGGMSMVIKVCGVVLKKEPLPLKKSLDLLDENSLAPYKVVSKENIEDQEVIKSLGTEDYIQWLLENTDAPVDSAVRKCSLFITYYELPDRVPHVPEECYTGGGYQSLSSDRVILKISKDGGERSIPGRYVVFASTDPSGWGGSTEFPILYVFNVNEKYTNSRNDTRMVLNRNLFGKYSYFSKIEWKFFNTGLSQTIYPSREEAITASQELLSVILPVLEKEHWPTGLW